MKRLLVSLLLAAIPAALLHAADITLPPAQTTGGMPLMEALSKRATNRSFDITRELSQQQLANLLWAGFGVNRPNGKRTAPSAHDRRENQLYVLLKDGAYAYNAQNHVLKQVCTEDIRKLGSRFSSPVVILYVADLSRASGSGDGRKNIACIDSAFIGQNIYLFCASEGLSTVYCGTGQDNETLAAKLQLTKDQSVLAAQPVGYPKP